MILLIEVMNKFDLNMEENEKLKYLYNALP